MREIRTLRLSRSQAGTRWRLGFHIGEAGRGWPSTIDDRVPQHRFATAEEATRQSGIDGVGVSCRICRDVGEDQRAEPRPMKQGEPRVRREMSRGMFCQRDQL